METGLTDNEREHVGAIDSVAIFGRCSRGRTLNRRWRAFAPMLAIAFAVLISSCDEKTDAKKHAEEFGSLLSASEALLGSTRITAVAAETIKEASFNRTLSCIGTVSYDQEGKRFIKIFVPVSGTTYEDRKKEAEGPEARRNLADCYHQFKVELPPQLSTADAKSSEMGEWFFGVGAALADNGPCLAKIGGSCGGSSTGDCCQN